MAAKKNDRAIGNEGTISPDSIEALRAANELFIQFMRRSPVYAYIKSVTPTESRILLASDNYQQMLDISNLDIVGKTIGELFPAEFAEKITSDDWVAFANGKVLALDKYMNGRNYVTIKFPFVHGDKNILAGYIVDVTVNEQAQKELRESEENFRLSHDESPLGLCVVTAEGEILYANRALLDMYDFESDEDLKATSLEEKYTPESYAEHRLREEKQRRGEQVPSNYEIAIIDGDGHVRNIEVYRKEVPWSGEVRFQLFHYDVTSRKEADERLREKADELTAREEKLRGESDALRTREEVLRAESESLKGREEKLREETELLRSGEEKLRAGTEVLREDMERLLRERETLQASDGKLREHRENIKKDREALRADEGKLQDESKTLREESEALRACEDKLREDVESLKAREDRLREGTESLRSGEEKLRADRESLMARGEKLKEEEGALKQREGTMRALFEAVGSAVAVADMAGKIVDVNKAWLDMSGYGDRTDVIGKSRLDFIVEEDRIAFARGQDDDGSAGTRVPVEMTMLRKDGGRYLCESISGPMCDASGNAVGVVYVDRDITRRRTAERAVLASLGEKEYLLQEINRQARNNLNSVLALMEMQRKTAEKSMWRSAPVLTPAYVSAFENRVRAMALVHERLYRSTNISFIDMQDYLDALVSNLRTSLDISAEISCSVNAAGIALKPEAAVPLGMVVNELATNAFKHAFPENKPQFGAENCRVSVSLERRGDDYKLIVDDNGAGLPKSFRLAETSTLGLQLVKMLGVDQLGGRLALNRTRGTRYILRFKAGG
ncbi:MAG: PAS domain S-box protein [Dehalococcoidia bacterium]|jgi:PAS domain S-box-containing protein